MTIAAARMPSKADVMAERSKIVLDLGTNTASATFVVSRECDAGVNECARVNFVRWDRCTGEGRPNDYL